MLATAEPPYFAESLEHMEVTTGDAVCLRCQVAGTPDIKVSWFKADGKVRSSPTCKLEYTKGVACLKLSKATKADVGEYTCKAENKIGSASSTCRINVLGDHTLTHLQISTTTVRYVFLNLIFYSVFSRGPNTAVLSQEDHQPAADGGSANPVRVPGRRLVTGRGVVAERRRASAARR